MAFVMSQRPRKSYPFFITASVNYYSLNRNEQLVVLDIYIYSYIYTYVNPTSPATEQISSYVTRISHQATVRLEPAILLGRVINDNIRGQLLVVGYFE